MIDMSNSSHIHMRLSTITIPSRLSQIYQHYNQLPELIDPSTSHFLAPTVTLMQFKTSYPFHTPPTPYIYSQPSKTTNQHIKKTPLQQKQKVEDIRASKSGHGSHPHIVTFGGRCDELLRDRKVIVRASGLGDESLEIRVPEDEGSHGWRSEKAVSVNDLKSSGARVLCAFGVLAFPHYRFVISEMALVK